MIGATIHLMEVHLTSEQPARLAQFATRVGLNEQEVVVEAIDRMFEYDESLFTAVEQGRAAARRGELLEHEEVVDRIEQLLHA